MDGMRGIELEFEGKHLLELAFYDNLRKNRYKSQDYVPEVYKENICKKMEIKFKELNFP